MPELIHSAARPFPAFKLGSGVWGVGGWGVELWEIAPMWPVLLVSDRCCRGQRLQSAVLFMDSWVTCSPPHGGRGARTEADFGHH